MRITYTYWHILFLVFRQWCLMKIGTRWLEQPLRGLSLPPLSPLIPPLVVRPQQMPQWRPSSLQKVTSHPPLLGLQDLVSPAVQPAFSPASSCRSPVQPPRTHPAPKSPSLVVFLRPFHTLFLLLGCSFFFFQPYLVNFYSTLKIQIRCYCLGPQRLGPVSLLCAVTATSTSH